MKALDYSDVDYHIRFNGVPKAQVKWFKDGKELKTGDRITIETTDEGQVSSSLSIKHFGVDDVGLVRYHLRCYVAFFRILNYLLKIFL